MVEDKIAGFVVLSCLVSIFPICFIIKQLKERRKKFLSRKRKDMIQVKTAHVQIPWDVFDIRTEFIEDLPCIANVFYPEFKSPDRSPIHLDYTDEFYFDYSNAHFRTRQEAEFFIKELIYCANYEPDARVIRFNWKIINQNFSKIKGLC